METIDDFLKVYSGYGYGDGSGSGYGYGDGSGYGYGYGYGYGDGSGDGSGYGYGYGSDIKQYNGIQIYKIDGIQTGITSVKGNIAKGFILNDDWTTSNCFIVKEGNYFAHGETLHDAFEALQEKLIENMPIEQRIEKFKAQFPDFSYKYPAKDLFTAHNLLTGSCKFGRKSWCENKGIDINKDLFTIHEFITLTKDSYKGEIILKLKK